MTLSSVHGQLLHYFLGVAVASGLGLAMNSLDGLPGRVVEEALAESADDPETEPDRLRVLNALADDAHPEIRVAVAGALGDGGAGDDREFTLLSQLAVDPEGSVREAAAASFPALLERAPVALRLESLATWATAEHEPQRLAAARSLGRRMPVPAADVLLAHLIDDESARVRRTALESARERFTAEPRVLRELAGAALADASRPVRRFARHLYVGTVTAPA